MMDFRDVIQTILYPPANGKAVPVVWEFDPAELRKGPKNFSINTFGPDGELLSSTTIRRRHD